MAVREFEIVRPTLSSAGVPQDYIWRMSAAQYHKMLETGILQDDDPIELLEGWLVYKMPKNPPHSFALRRTQKSLDKLLPEGWFLSQQDPILFEDSEPEPDLAVVVGEFERYALKHPIPAEVAIVIEVSDSTLDRDKTIKQRIYARGRIPHYWILDLVQNAVQVYSEPTGFGQEARYLKQALYQGSDAIPVIVDNKTIGTIVASEVLP